MSFFQEELFESQLTALVIESLINFNYLNDQKFYCSQLEFSDDEEKYFVSVYQAETKISEEEKIYFLFVEGKDTPQPFQLLLIGSEPENLFLFCFDLEEESGKIYQRQKRGLNNQLFWVSPDIQNQLEVTLLVTKIDRQGSVLQPTEYKRKEFLSPAQNYLINYLNR